MWGGLRAVLRLSAQRVWAGQLWSEDARLEIPQQWVFPGLSSSAVLVGNHSASDLVSVSLVAAERTAGTMVKDVTKRSGSSVCHITLALGWISCAHYLGLSTHKLQDDNWGQQIPDVINLLNFYTSSCLLSFSPRAPV